MNTDTIVKYAKKFNIKHEQIDNIILENIDTCYNYRNILFNHTEPEDEFDMRDDLAREGFELMAAFTKLYNGLDSICDQLIKLGQEEDNVATYGAGSLFVQVLQDMQYAVKRLNYVYREEWDTAEKAGVLVDYSYLLAISDLGAIKAQMNTVMAIITGELLPAGKWYNV